MARWGPDPLQCSGGVVWGEGTHGGHFEVMPPKVGAPTIPPNHVVSMGFLQDGPAPCNRGVPPHWEPHTGPSWVQSQALPLLLTALAASRWTMVSSWGSPPAPRPTRRWRSSPRTSSLPSKTTVTAMRTAQGATVSDTGGHPAVTGSSLGVAGPGLPTSSSSLHTRSFLLQRLLHHRLQF